MSPTDSEAVLPVQQPGLGLRQAREAAGISLPDLSKKTLIAPHRLKALERDDYDAAGGATYVKGYARAYARLLNLDPAKTVRLFEEQLEPTAQPEAAAEHSPDNHESRHGNEFSARATGFFTQATKVVQTHKRGMVGAVLILLIAVILLVLNPDDQQSEGPVLPPGMDDPASSPPELQPESTPPEPATEPEVPAPEMTPESESGSTTSLAAGDQVLGSADELTPDLPSSSSDGTDSSVSSPTTASTSTSPSIPEATSSTASENNRTLEFHFTDACWLEVVDANGERIIAREAQSGDNLRLSGSAPFSIVLGNAPAASIAIDGEPVDIKPRSSTNVLRLNLGGDS